MLEGGLVLIGGALGALTRWGISRWIRVETALLSTLVVNVIGCFLMGILSALRFTCAYCVFRGKYLAASALMAALNSSMSAFLHPSAFGW